MKSSPQNTPKSGIGPQDILFVFFKHKWMILICSLLGLGGAASLYHTRKPVFKSEAKLLVRYVIDRRSFDTDLEQPTGGSRAPDNVINSELEILRSSDLALDVAKKVGPERLAPGPPPVPTLDDAAGSIVANMVAKAMPNTKVIHITYVNPDPEVTTLVLRELVDRYLEKHFEIHRSVGAFDSVAKQTEQVKSRLKSTEDELNRLKSENGIISLADATLAFGSKRARAQEDLMTAEAQYAEQKSFTDALEKMAAGTGNPTAAGEPTPPAQTANLSVLSEYKVILEKLGELQKRDLDLRLKYPSASPTVILNQRQIDDLGAKRRAMVALNPSLEGVVSQQDAVTSAVDSGKALEDARMRLGAIDARMSVFRSQVKNLQNQFTQLSEVGVKIQNLERQKEMEEGEYRLLESNLKRARVDQSLDPSKVPNISVVQQPSAPVKSYDPLINKLILALAGGGIAAGLGLAFLIELVLNRRISRPAEIEARLQLPLMLSIPFIRPKDRKELLLPDSPRLNLLGNSEGKSYPVSKTGKVERDLSPRSEHFMLPYTQAIRDRIVFNFGINNIHHKPKLIGLTGLTGSAGTSTIAAGLAKAFSEAEGVKVLLVDLNPSHKVANPAFEESEALSLADALRNAKDERFKDDEKNLYLASTALDSNVSIFAPIHLQQLMPYLQSSDFDYILFDLPPMDHTSPTIAMAGLLDKILLVLDGDDTTREGLKWGYSALVKGRADVSCIFNKARSHAPRWIAG